MTTAVDAELYELPVQGVAGGAGLVAGVEGGRCAELLHELGDGLGGVRNLPERAHLTAAFGHRHGDGGRVHIESDVAYVKPRGIAFERLEEPELYRIELNGIAITANLANRKREALRDDDPRAIHRFVDDLIRSVTDAFNESPWDRAKSLIYFAAESSDGAFDDAIRSDVTPHVVRVVTLTDEGHTRITWVTPRMLMAWGITERQLLDQALLNQDLLLRDIELDVQDARGHKLGMVPLDSPYKASVIFAPCFREFVSSKLGWPVLVVIPCRDFIYVIQEDQELVNRLGRVVVEEYQSSGYPITTEVLRISDEGIRALGRFPADRNAPEAP